MKQLHKKFNDCQVKDLMTQYLQKKIERKDLQKVLGIKKTRFFALIKRLKEDPENFSVSYFRSMPTRKISKNIVETPRASPWSWHSALRVNKRTSRL